MAGPPLAPSSNVNTQKEDKKKTEEQQPCPKRRRKSIDEQDQAQQAPARGAPKQDEDDGDAEEAAVAVPAVVAEETPDEIEQNDIPGAEERHGARESGIDEEEEQEEDEEEEEEVDGEDSSQEETDLGNEEISDRAETGDGGPGAGTAAGEAGARSRADEDKDKGGDKPDGSKIARARSAWMLFLADNREAVRKEHPGLAVGPMQKILSEMWKGLGEDEAARYAKMAVEDKERMKKELAAAGLTKLPAKNSSAVTVAGGPTSLVLPLARVRKAVRLDPAVGNISKEGLLLLTKATEVFMTVVADHAWKIGRQTGRKSIRPCDVADFVFAAPEMYWLKDEFRDERSSAKKKQSKPEASGAKADLAKKATAAAAAAMPKGAKPITSFFQKA